MNDTNNLATVHDTNLARLQSITLPKWPQMLVWGAPVSREQALDIILRTDPFLHSFSTYHGGNNTRWNNWAREKLGLCLVDSALANTNLSTREQLDVQYKAQELLSAALGVVQTEYVSNTWASCAFIYGPHGWMHPDGSVGFIDNVGKWPDAKEVYNDWLKLSAAFPFLNLHATLMSGEECEDDSYPLVTFRIAAGAVTVLEEAFAPAVTPSRRSSQVNFANPSREQGLSNETIEALADIVKPLAQRAVLEAFTPQLQTTHQALLAGG